MTAHMWVVVLTAVCLALTTLVVVLVRSLITTRQREHHAELESMRLGAALVKVVPMGGQYRAEQAGVTRA